MRKFIYILPIIALLLASCAENNTLTGTYADNSNDGKKVYLLTLKSLNDQFVPVDSTEVKDGKFTFKLNEVGEPSMAYLAIRGAKVDAIPFVYEKGNIVVSIDSVARVKGTPLNDKCQAFFDETLVLMGKMEQLDKNMAEATDDSIRVSGMAEMTKLNDDMRNIGFKFVKENIKNKVGEFYSIHFLNMFTDEQIKELKGSAGAEHLTIMNKLLGGQEQVAEQSGFVGTKFLDISGNNPDGKKIALSDYAGKGKVVLLDFWASWCGPCIQEMPNVVKAYEAYKAKGFEIVGVSLDEDKAAWLATSKRLNVTWPQMSDLKGWESAISAVYHVNSIPFTLLIDKDGTIVAENLRGSELERKLSELLK